MALSQQYTFGFIDQLVRINFPQAKGDFLYYAGVQGAGSDNPVVSTSKNGLDWVKTTPPVAGSRTNPACFAFGQSLWLATSSTGVFTFPGRTLFQSTDKTKTWSVVGSFPSTVSPYSVAFGNNIFLVLASNNDSTDNDDGTSSIWISKDKAKTWAQVSIPNSFVAHSVAYINNAFFVMTHNAQSSDYNGGNPNCFILRSVNGTSWSSIQMYSDIAIQSSQLNPEDPVSYGVRSVMGMAYNSSEKLFIATGYTAGTGGTFTTSVSSDGISWDGGTRDGVYSTSSFLSQTGQSCGVAAGNGVFVAAAFNQDGAHRNIGYALTSTNGGGWEETILIAPSGSGPTVSIDGQGMPLFAPTGRVFTIMMSRADPASGGLFNVHIFQSPDGFTWNEADYGFNTSGENDTLGGAIGEV